MSDPHQRLEPDLRPNAKTREGRMLAAGRLEVTVTSAATGRHITLKLRAARRDDRPDAPRRWPVRPFDEASHLFVEDARGTRIATVLLERDSIRWAEGATPAARWTLVHLLKLLAGRPTPMAEQATIVAADVCGACGLPLTDPESIARGLGPTCANKATHSRHEPAVVATAEVA